MSLSPYFDASQNNHPPHNPKRHIFLVFGC
jgi:hypothetical protein